MPRQGKRCAREDGSCGSASLVDDSQACSYLAIHSDVATAPTPSISLYGFTQAKQRFEEDQDNEESSENELAEFKLTRREIEAERSLQEVNNLTQALLEAEQEATTIIEAAERRKEEVRHQAEASALEEIESYRKVCEAEFLAWRGKVELESLERNEETIRTILQQMRTESSQLTGRDHELWGEAGGLVFPARRDTTTLSTASLEAGSMVAVGELHSQQREFDIAKIPSCSELAGMKIATAARLTPAMWHAATARGFSWSQCPNLEIVNLHSALLKMPQGAGAEMVRRLLETASSAAENDVMSICMRDEVLREWRHSGFEGLRDGDFMLLKDLQLHHAPSLRELYLVENQLDALPQWLGDIANLEILDISSNKLSVLPLCICQLSNLQTLSLNRNRLESVPSSICQISTLQVLSLNQNKLTQLPSALGDLQSLRILALESNLLVEVPESIGQLSKLEALDLGHNRLIGLPSSIAGLKQLRGLALDHNQLVDIPPALGELSSLRGLRLNHNLLMSLPATLGFLRELRLLAVEHNQLENLPVSLGQLTELRYLTLHENNLENLPSELRTLEQMKALTVGRNLLTKLTVGDFMSHWAALETLSAEKNGLVTLCESVKYLRSLKELDLTRNRISVLPAALWTLDGLVTLNLEHNELQNLPDSIGGLLALQELKLGHNQLASLPFSIGGLRKLQSLRLEFNRLEELPSEMGTLIQLAALSLSHNSLTRLPDELAALRKLTWLALEYNPLHALPRDMLASLAASALSDLLVDELQADVMAGQLAPYHKLVLLTPGGLDALKGTQSRKPHKALKAPVAATATWQPSTMDAIFARLATTEADAAMERLLEELDAPTKKAKKKTRKKAKKDVPDDGAQGPKAANPQSTPSNKKLDTQEDKDVATSDKTSNDVLATRQTLSASCDRGGVCIDGVGGVAKEDQEDQEEQWQEVKKKHKKSRAGKAKAWEAQEVCDVPLPPRQSEASRICRVIEAKPSRGEQPSAVPVERKQIEQTPPASLTESNLIQHSTVVHMQLCEQVLADVLEVLQHRTHMVLHGARALNYWLRGKAQLPTIDYDFKDHSHHHTFMREIVTPITAMYKPIVGTHHDSRVEVVLSTVSMQEPGGVKPPKEVGFVPRLLTVFVHGQRWIDITCVGPHKPTAEMPELPPFSVAQLNSRGRSYNVNIESFKSLKNTVEQLAGNEEQGATRRDKAKFQLNFLNSISASLFIPGLSWSSAAQSVPSRQSCRDGGTTSETVMTTSDSSDSSTRWGSGSQSGTQNPPLQSAWPTGTPVRSVQLHQSAASMDNVCCGRPHTCVCRDCGLVIKTSNSNLVIPTYSSDHADIATLPQSSR